MHKSGDRLSLGVNQYWPQWHLQKDLALMPVNGTTKLQLSWAIDFNIVLKMGGTPMLSALYQCSAFFCGDYGFKAFFLLCKSLIIIYYSHYNLCLLAIILPSQRAGWYELTLMVGVESRWRVVKRNYFFPVRHNIADSKGNVCVCRKISVRWAQ